MKTSLSSLPKKNLERINDSVSFLITLYSANVFVRGVGLEISSALQVPVGFRVAFYVTCLPQFSSQIGLTPPIFLCGSIVPHFTTQGDSRLLLKMKLIGRAFPGHAFAEVAPSQGNIIGRPERKCSGEGLVKGRQNERKATTPLWLPLTSENPHWTVPRRDYLDC